MSAHAVALGLLFCRPQRRVVALTCRVLVHVSSESRVQVCFQGGGVVCCPLMES